MKVVAVIPVRKGSERVISKNTKPFADTTLLDLKLEVMKQVKGLDNLIVNTDCDICIDIAKNHGVEIHRRDDYFASSLANNREHWTNLAEVTDTDILMMCQCTNPMVTVTTHEQALTDYLASIDQYNSAISVSAQKKFLWQDGSPINYDFNKTPKSQNLPDIVSLNFAITISNKQEMFKTGNVISANPKFIELDRVQSLDVDWPIDFEFAEYVYKKHGLDWLSS